MKKSLYISKAKQVKEIEQPKKSSAYLFCFIIIFFSILFAYAGMISLWAMIFFEFIALVWYGFSISENIKKQR